MRPLEKLAAEDLSSEVFAGQPASYCVATAEQAEDDIAVWRSSVRLRFAPSAHYKTVARDLGCRPAAADSPVDETERLRLIGLTRQVDRYPGETDAQYCERLAGAFVAHHEGGTESAIVSQIKAFGIPDVTVWEEYEYHLTTSDEYGHRFVVVLGPDYGALGWTGCTLGSVVLGSTVLGLGNTVPLHVQALRRIVVKWKHVFSFPVRIICLFNGAAPLGMAELGAVVLGVTDVASIEMGSVRMLGNAILGEHKGIGFEP